MARKPEVTEIETFPEADCLEGFAHPRVTARLFGHGEAEASFRQGFDSGRLHHAWLIGGARGIGKATLAYRLARFILASDQERQGDGLDVSEEGQAWRQVLALSHPRLLLIRRPYDIKTKRFAASIPVDQVRRIRSFLAYAAEAGAYRVVIVDQADELNGSAANALLKSLEEPPPLCVFLLVSSEPGRLLATIKSRCRRFDLAPLGADDLKRAVDQACAAVDTDALSAKAWQKLEPISQGSVRRVLQLSQSDGVALQERVTGLLGMLPKVDWSAVHGLADDLTGAGKEQRFEIFFDLLLETIADMVRARAVGANMRAGGIDCTRVIDESRIAGWAELWERVVARKAEALALNLDRRSLIVETVTRLQAIARS